MALESYFQNLLDRVENSDIGNNGTDKNGFFLPVRTLLLRHLQLLKDLHAKPNARSMVRTSWKFVVDHLPPDWLILNSEQKKELQKILEE